MRDGLGPFSPMGHAQEARTAGWRGAESCGARGAPVVFERLSLEEGALPNSGKFKRASGKKRSLNIRLTGMILC